MMNIYYFLGGCVFTSIIFLLFKKKSRISVPDLPIKRGLISRNYTATTGNSLGTDKKTIEVDFELMEIDSSDSRSKVKILEMIVNQSEFNTTEWKTKILNQINNTWILSSEIEWITNVKKEVRNKKIEELLKN